MDAVDLLIGLLIAFAGGANDADLRTRSRQRAAFMPDTAVKWQRQVLDNNQNLAARQRFLRTNGIHAGGGDLTAHNRIRHSNSFL